MKTWREHPETIVSNTVSDSVSNKASTFLCAARRTKMTTRALWAARCARLPQNPLHYSFAEKDGVVFVPMKLEL